MKAQYISHSILKTLNNYLGGKILEIKYLKKEVKIYNYLNQIQFLLKTEKHIKKELKNQQK